MSFDGFIISKNCQIWDSENQLVIVRKQMHAKRATVWCGFWTRPLFFENAAGQASRVDGARYSNIIIKFFVPKFQDKDEEDM